MIVGAVEAGGLVFRARELLEGAERPPITATRTAFVVETFDPTTSAWTSKAMALWDGAVLFDVLMCGQSSEPVPDNVVVSLGRLIGKSGSVFEGRRCAKA